MSIILNTKELDAVYCGDKEIVSVMYGEDVVWEGKKGIYLGNGKTFDVSSFSGYGNLTSDNFFTTGGQQMSDSVSQNNVETYTTITTKSYNSSTGALTFMRSTSGSGSKTANLDVYLVKSRNLLKIADAGESSNEWSIDVSSLIPEWRTLTADNFMCKVFPTAYGRYTCYVSNCSFTINQLNKSYDATTGLLKWNIYGNTSTGSFNTVQKHPEIYYVPKIEI